VRPIQSLHSNKVTDNVNNEAIICYSIYKTIYSKKFHIPEYLHIGCQILRLPKNLPPKIQQL